MNEKIFQQIQAMRSRPDCPNMFDVKAVFELAIQLQMDALAEYVFMNTSGYSAFILTGEWECSDAE